MAENPGMTQVKLAKVCGVSQPSVNDWLSGKTKAMRGPGLLLAAAALGVNALWLGTGKGVMRPVAGQSQPVGIDPATLSEALKLLDIDESLGGKYGFIERAQRLIHVYEAFPAGATSPPRELVDEILAHAKARGSKQGDGGHGKTVSGRQRAAK